MVAGGGRMIQRSTAGASPTLSTLVGASIPCLFFGVKFAFFSIFLGAGSGRVDW